MKKVCWRPKEGPSDREGLLAECGAPRDLRAVKGKEVKKKRTMEFRIRDKVGKELETERRSRGGM